MHRISSKSLTVAVFAAISLGLPTAGCRPSTEGASGGLQPVRKSGNAIAVVATTGIVTDLVQSLAARMPAEIKVGVTSLMGPGVDPHLYTPTRQDILRLKTANMVFGSGLKLEGHLEETLDAVAASGTDVVFLANFVAPSDLRVVDASSNTYDPHFWLSVPLWKQAALGAAESLAKRSSAFAPTWKGAAADYVVELDQLDAEIRKAIDTIPAGGRVLVTSHDSFSYFAKTYGLTADPVQGVTTESEPGVADINRIVELVVSRKLPVVFSESGVNSKSLEAIVEGARSRGHRVQLAGPLYSDSLGAIDPRGIEHSTAATYLQMMRYNARTIAEGLGGSVPSEAERTGPSK